MEKSRAMKKAGLTSKPAGLFPIGLWLTTLALALQVLAFLCQLVSVLNWEEAVRLGLHPDRFSGGDDAEHARARLQWGNAVVDVLMYLPMNIVATLDLATRRHSMIGFVGAFCALFFGVYWPLSVAFQWPWTEYMEKIVSLNLVFGLTSALGLWGLLANRNQYFDSANKKL